MKRHKVLDRIEDQNPDEDDHRGMKVQLDTFGNQMHKYCDRHHTRSETGEQTHETDL